MRLIVNLFILVSLTVNTIILPVYDPKNALSTKSLFSGAKWRHSFQETLRHSKDLPPEERTAAINEVLLSAPQGYLLIAKKKDKPKKLPFGLDAAFQKAASPPVALRASPPGVQSSSPTKTLVELLGDEEAEIAFKSVAERLLLRTRNGNFYFSGLERRQYVHFLLDDYFQMKMQKMASLAFVKAIQLDRARFKKKEKKWPGLGLHDSTVSIIFRSFVHNLYYKIHRTKGLKQFWLDMVDEESVFPCLIKAFAPLNRLPRRELTGHATQDHFLELFVILTAIASKTALNFEKYRFEYSSFSGGSDVSSDILNNIYSLIKIMSKVIPAFYEDIPPRTLMELVQLRDFFSETFRPHTSEAGWRLEELIQKVETPEKLLRVRQLLKAANAESIIATAI